jgi:hypothetical protein
MPRSSRLALEIPQSHSLRPLPRPCPKLPSDWVLERATLGMQHAQSLVMGQATVSLITSVRQIVCAGSASRSSLVGSQSQATNPSRYDALEYHDEKSLLAHVRKLAGLGSTSGQVQA